MIKTFLTIDNKTNLIDIDSRKVYRHCHDDNQIYELVKVTFQTFINYMFNDKYKQQREIILAQVLEINGEQFITTMTSYGATVAQQPPKI